jgi:hypothetical protein
MSANERAETRNVGQISRGTRLLVWAGVALSGGAASVACASPHQDDGISYSRDVQPLFERRCVICHHSGNSGLVDIEDPFTPDFGSPGLIGSKHEWAANNTLPAYNVVPFQPEASFLLQKVTDRELKPGCDPDAGPCKFQEAGFFMPPLPKRLPDAKLTAVRLWIELGAQNDAFYRQEVEPIFGNPANRSDTECENGGMDPGCIVCVSCHYDGSPNPPDLTQPFDPIVGIIGVKSTFRADLDIVTPGDPQSSFLVHKLEAGVASSEGGALKPFVASSEVGAPMPYGYPALSDNDVDVLWQWIAEGATRD